MTIQTNKRQTAIDAVLDFPQVGANDSAILTVASPHTPVQTMALVSPPPSLNGIASAGTLTMDTQPTDGDTMTLDTKVYTFEDTLTDVDGNIYTGADLAAAKVNTVAAINLGAGAGTGYAASTTAGTVTADAAFVGDDLVVTYTQVGTAGDAIATTETFTEGTNVFDAATLGTTTAGADASGLTVDAYVAAANVVTVRLTNASASAAEPLSGTFKVLVWN